MLRLKEEIEEGDQDFRETRHSLNRFFLQETFVTVKKAIFLAGNIRDRQ